MLNEARLFVSGIISLSLFKRSNDMPDSTIKQTQHESRKQTQRII